MRARAIFLVLGVVMAAGAWGAEQERIRDFHSDIAIGADGSLTITETIRLVSAGNKIKRGILRDFPVVLRDAKRRRIYGFEVKGVLRDGQAEPYVVDRGARFHYARIKIGSESALLPPGEHTYAITYITTNHVRFFDDHDELYFNVNGTEWEFPFDKVSATVTLPKGGKLYKDLVNGFTGAEGQKGKDYKAKGLPDGRVFFETTRALKAGENLTIVVPLDKGAVKEPPPPPEEKILDFHSDIMLGTDGTLAVTETIRLVVAGVKIDHGFERDFPLIRRGLYQRETCTATVERVLRDGSKEPFSANTEEVPDHLHVKFGTYDFSVPDGEHTYVIAYQAMGHVRFLPGRDELAFDVNGTGWELAAEKVSATITLPQGAKLLADRVRGVVGAGGKDFTWKQLADGRVAFEATRRLQPGENLAIVVPLAKGALAEPSAEEKRRAWVDDNLPAAVSLGGLAAVVAFFVVGWVLLGGWPLRAAAVPRPEPPTDPETGRTLSPAEMACVHNMGFDGDCVAPALLDMGIRGYLTIEETKVKEDVQYTIRQRPDADPSKLTADELRFAEKAFAGHGAIVLKDDEPNLLGGVKAMRDAVEKDFGRGTFRRRTFLRALGWVLAVGATVATAFCTVLADPLAHWTFIAAVCAPGLLLVYYGLRYLRRERRRIAADDPRKQSSRGYLLDVVAIGIGSAAVVGWLYWLSHFSTVWVPLGVFGMFLANVELGPFLRRYTRRGRLLMDQARQLALYMTTKAQDKAPRPTGPEPFETLLPYAMALGVAGRWAHTFFDNFQREAANAATEWAEGGSTPIEQYAPAWWRAEQAFSLFEKRFTQVELFKCILRRVAPKGKVTSAGAPRKASTSSRTTWRASTTGSGARGSSGGGSGGGGGKGW